MRLLNISNRIPYPLRDGGAIAHYRQLKSMQDNGIKVDLLALNTLKHYVNDEDINRHIRPLCRVEYCTIDTSLSALKALKAWTRGKSYNIERFKSQPFTQKLEHMLSSGQYDLVQVESLFMSPYIPVIRRFGIPVVLRQHNVEYQIWKRMATECRNLLKKIILHKLASDMRRAESEALQSADAIVAITEEDKLLFEQMGCQVPIHVYGAGIDARVFVGIPPGPSNILYHLGSMEWEPNRNGLKWFLAEVWPRLLEENKHLKLHIAGKGMKHHFSGSLPEGVINFGEVESSKDFISQAGICIVPIQSGSGLRIKILEAMASGRAVVSTSVGVQGLELKSGEHYLVADSPGDFADAIMHLQNEQTYRRLSINARDTCLMKYDAVTLGKNLISFYEQFLNTFKPNHPLGEKGTH